MRDILNSMKKKDPSRRNLLSLGAGLATLTACNTAKQETPSALGAPAPVEVWRPVAT